MYIMQEGVKVKRFSVNNVTYIQMEKLYQNCRYAKLGFLTLISIKSNRTKEIKIELF